MADPPCLPDEGAPRLPYSSRVTAGSDPQLPFAPSSLVEDHGWWAFWRDGDLLGIRIVGELNDERNPQWRARLDEHVEAHGWPRIAALDVTEAIPAASLPYRARTALWGRRVLSNVDRALVVASAESQLTFTVRAILRMAGVPNVVFVNDAARAQDEFRALLDSNAPD